MIDPLEEDFEQPHLDPIELGDVQFISSNKAIVHRQFFEASRFEDSDNMPDDPELQDLEEIVF